MVQILVRIKIFIRDYLKNCTCCAGTSHYIWIMFLLYILPPSSSREIVSRLWRSSKKVARPSVVTRPAAGAPILMLKLVYLSSDPRATFAGSTKSLTMGEIMLVARSFTVFAIFWRTSFDTISRKVEKTLASSFKHRACPPFARTVAEVGIFYTRATSPK